MQFSWLPDGVFLSYNCVLKSKIWWWWYSKSGRA